MENIVPQIVQKIMGHANISTTMIYSHLATDHLRNAIKRVSSRIATDTKVAH